MEAGQGGGGTEVDLHDLLQVRERSLAHVTHLAHLSADLVIDRLDLSERTVEDALNTSLVEAAGDRGRAGGPAGLQLRESAGLGEAAGLSQVLPGQVELVVDGNIFTGLGGSRDRGHRHNVVISSIQCVHSLLDLHVVKILSLSEHHPPGFVFYFELKFRGQLPGVHVKYEVELQFI